MTDWLYHHLDVGGASEAVAAFARAAAGAGTIPWVLDLDRLEEDYFLRLASGRDRTLSVDGARMLAAELRDAVATRHALAVARVGRSTACPFDLHALLPVPEAVLRLGPDDESAASWLWAHWGTTQALRHVARMPAGKRGAGPGLRLSFWSADWTPWRALAALRAAWPGLRLEVRPVYDLS